MSRLLALWIGSLLVVSAPAEAAPDRTPGPTFPDARAQRTRVAQRGPGRRARNPQQRRERVREKIRAMRAWKLTEGLGLDEATAAKLFPILNEYDERFAAKFREATALRRALHEELQAAKPNRAKINKLIDELVGSQRALWEAQEARFAAVRKVLTPEQAAKALVLLPEIDRAVRREIRRVIERAGGAEDAPPDLEF